MFRHECNEIFYIHCTLLLRISIGFDPGDSPIRVFEFDGTPTFFAFYKDVVAVHLIPKSVQMMNYNSMEDYDELLVH